MRNIKYIGNIRNVIVAIGPITQFKVLNETRFFAKSIPETKAKLYISLATWKIMHTLRHTSTCIIPHVSL